MSEGDRLIISAPRGSGGALNHLTQIVPRLLALRPDWHIELWSTADVFERAFGRSDAPWMNILSEKGTFTRIWWEFVALPNLVRRDRRALIYAPFGPMLNLGLAPRLVFMARHIVPLLDPEEWELSEGDKVRVMALRHVFALSARSALGTICVSEHARRRLAALAQIPIESIDMIRHGVQRGSTDRTCSDPGAERVRGAPFFLHVGQPVPHRRVRELVEGYAKLADRHLDLPRLVLVGATRGVDEGYAASYRAIASPLIASTRIVLLDQLSHADVLTLTREAFAIVYPSVHEDCPNALLEGLAAGRPIICADTDASHELAESASVFVADPTPETLANAMEQLLDASRRDALAKAASKRGAEFSWDKCAQRTAVAIEKSFGRLRRTKR